MSMNIYIYIFAIFVRASIYREIAHLRIARKPQICNKKKKCENACQISKPISAMTKCANRKLAFYKRNQTESCVIAILSWRLTQMHYECAFTIWASAWDFQQFGMCDQQSLRPACAYAQSDQSLCLSLEYSMIVKLLTERHLEFLSLKGGCTGSSECTLVKMSNCWKSRALAHICYSIYWFGRTGH